MLSFNKGSRAIAAVSGGKLNNKILKIDDSQKKQVKFQEPVSSSDEEEDEEEYDIEYPAEYLDDKFYSKAIPGRLTREKKHEIYEDLNIALEKKSKKKLPEKLHKAYELAMQKIISDMQKEVKLNDGKLIPIPQKFDSGSEHGYVAGPSGSGKSTYVGEYIRLFKQQHPKAKVWMFSRVDKDAAIDKYGVNRITLDEGLVESPITPSELSGGKPTLVIFDDIDTIRDKKIKENVCGLRDDILETGRHDNITSISTNHIICDYKNTKRLLNEAKYITLFPKSGSTFHIKRVLKEYVGLDQATIKKILSLDSRWVTVYKVAPMLVIYERGCFLIS